MSFADYEEGAASAVPVLLFVFKYSGETFRYTNHDQDVVVDHTTYTAIPITSDNFVSTSESDNSSLAINVPIGNPVAELFKVYPPSEVVSATVFCENVIDDSSDYVVFWKGRITSAQWQPDCVTLNTDSILLTMQRGGLQTRFSKQCTTYIYSSLCKMVPATWRVKDSCGAVSGRVITVAAAIGKDDNYFAGGYMEYVDSVNGNTQVRTIRSSLSASGELTLAQAPMNLIAGMEVSLYPGCDNTLATCDAKFSNTPNYRGTPYIPTSSPFGGTALY